MGSLTSTGDYQAFAESAKAVLNEVAPAARLEVVGSVARGESSPPYSDLDLLLIAPSGEGPRLRDRVPEIARRMGGLLTIFVDPFSFQGCICSVYAGPRKVDWFVAEETPAGRALVWTGLQPPPADSAGHLWDWIWWIWGKVRTGRAELAARELAKLWQFLVLQGASAQSFPPTVPDPDRDDLVRLVLATLDHLPSSVAEKEVRPAIEADVRVDFGDDAAV